MDSFYRGTLLVIVLALAILCYQIGFTKESYAVVGLGVILELSFWVGLYRKTQR